jgi:hypothetical protein
MCPAAVSFLAASAYEKYALCASRTTHKIPRLQTQKSEVTDQETLVRALFKTCETLTM